MFIFVEVKKRFCHIVDGISDISGLMLSRTLDT
jgi:hypothetical protein